MPICPNCESSVEYKGGMVCKKCEFDFKRYLFVSWELLYFKFHPAEHTVRLKALWVFRMVMPMVTTIGIGLGIYLWVHPLIAIAFICVFVPPITAILTVLPIRALLREDRLRKGVIPRKRRSQTRRSA